MTPQGLEGEAGASTGPRPRVHTGVYVVGRDMVAVVVDSGLPSLPYVDLVCARDQARLMNVFREPHMVSPHIVEDDVLLPRDLAGV